MLKITTHQTSNDYVYLSKDMKLDLYKFILKKLKY